MKQHLGKPKHVEVLKLVFSNTAKRCETSTSSLSTTLPSQKKVLIAPSLLEKVSAAGAMWLSKIAEEDMPLRNCDNATSLFQCMFSDSRIAKTFTIGRSKASYIFQDWLGSLLAKWLCQSASNSEEAFSLIFDEATTNQRQKQMDLLRFWDKNINCIVTKYLGSLYFGRATATDLTSMLTDIMNGDEYDIPWKRLIYVSSDGPNINKAVWINLRNN